mgnify:CR=1 FL=1
MEDSQLLAELSKLADFNTSLLPVTYPMLQQTTTNLDTIPLKTLLLLIKTADYLQYESLLSLYMTELVSRINTMNQKELYNLTVLFTSITIF